MTGLHHIAICRAYIWRIVWFLGMMIVLGVTGGHAQNAGMMPLNPTGRTIEMVVPLHYDRFYLGDLPIRLTADQNVEIEQEAALRSLRELLRAEALTLLESIPPNEKGYYRLSDLQKSGFAFAFDPGEVMVKFAPSIDQKQKGNISVQTRQAQIESANIVPPADFAGFVNMRSAIDYLGNSAIDNIGLTAPRFDFEGSARWQNIVLEAEVTFEPDDVSTFGKPGAGIKRRGTRLVHDIEERDIRASLGDVYPIGTGLQTTPDILGLSVEHSQSKLHPGRNIRSTSTHSFRLERPSNIDIIVNGQIIRQLRLDPGDYDIGDLPIASGANDVVLQIHDDVGNARQLQFSLFRDDSLLVTGTSEWAASAGIPTDFDEGQPNYGMNDYFMSGYYRRGLTDSITSEAHMQMDRQVLMAGSALLFGNALGLFRLESATSLFDHEVWGYAINADYALTGIEDSQGSIHNFRLSAQLRNPDFTTPGNGTATLEQHWLSISAAYSRTLPFNIAGYFSAAYMFGHEEEADGYGADISLSRNFDRFAVGVSAGYAAANNHENELSMLLRLRYDLNDQGMLSSIHDVRNSRSTASYTRQDNQWQTSLDLTHVRTDSQGHEQANADDISVNGSLHYTGNRGNIAVSQDTRFAGLTTDTLDQRTSLRGEMAFAFADGHVAIGRPIANGFAIIHPHESLTDNDIAIGRGMNSAVTRTDMFGPALLPALSPQTLNRVQYEVADLPPGYDLGTNNFDLKPDYKSGYALEIGSAYTVSVFGTLLDAQDKPIALLSGKAIQYTNPNKQIEIFTNRAGRFSAQGLAPGKWTIEIATEPITHFTFIVPEETVGLYRTGSLRPSPNE